jgi:hypothetical protein
MQYLVEVPCVVQNCINNSELQIRVLYFRFLRATDRINKSVHRSIGMKVWRGAMFCIIAISNFTHHS